MAHDQSIVQALSIFHLQEKTKKKAERHYYSYWENGLNMEVDGSYLLYFCFFFYWFLFNGIL